MNEHYLHLLWRQKRLPFHKFLTTTGKPIHIHHPGDYNSHSGPDFFNGRVELDGVTYAGNIEFHVNSSDWYLHNHHHDPAYENVILHVVYNHDVEVRIGNDVLPVIELKNLIDWKHFNQYRKTVSVNTIVCKNSLVEIDRVHIQQQIEKSIISRIERKTKIFMQQFGDTNPQQLLLILIGQAFGMKTNAMPFMHLAGSVPLTEVLRSSPSELEGIIYGLSGLLETRGESGYARKLSQTWNYQRTRLRLHAINPVAWKFKGTRPTGFPTIRLAQFAKFISAMDWSADFWELPEKLILQRMREMLCLPLPDYWQRHYDFDRPFARPILGMSKASADVIVINAVVPFLHAMAERTHNQAFSERALDLLHLIPAEKNETIEQWKSLGVTAKNAADSQGLLELKHELCIRRKCLDCKIGQRIFSQ